MKIYNREPWLLRRQSMEVTTAVVLILISNGADSTADDIKKVPSSLFALPHPGSDVVTFRRVATS